MKALRIVQFSLWALAGFAAVMVVFQYTIASRSIPAPLPIGGPIELMNQHGNRFTQADLEGKPYGVFFGFTHCPEVCPTTLMEVSSLMAQLGDEADKFVPLFVTVDPERDTVDALARYMTSFDPRIVALTGSTDEIASLAKSYRAYFRKVPTGGQGYTMDHTATFYLMDLRGQFSGTLDLHEPAETKLAKLKRLIGAVKG